MEQLRRRNFRGCVYRLKEEGVIGRLFMHVGQPDILASLPHCSSVVCSEVDGDRPGYVHLHLNLNQMFPGRNPPIINLVCCGKLLEHGFCCLTYLLFDHSELKSHFLFYTQTRQALYYFVSSKYSPAKNLDIHYMILKLVSVFVYYYNNPPPPFLNASSPQCKFNTVQIIGQGEQFGFIVWKLFETIKKRASIHSRTF